MKLTLREAAARTGVGLTILYKAADRGSLKVSLEKREVVSARCSRVMTIRVVTVEDLDAYMEARERRSRNRKGKPTSWNPYPDHWIQGKIPEHLQDRVVDFWRGVEAEINYRRRQRRKAEVAM